MRPLQILPLGMNKKIYTLFITLLFIFPLASYSKLKPSPPAVPYMDQVIKRKKRVIAKKCLKYIKEHTKGFIMIEIKVSTKGKAKARLIGTEINNKDFLNCTLSILNRIQFKKIKKVSRIYRFFIL